MSGFRDLGYGPQLSRRDVRADGLRATGEAAPAEVRKRRLPCATMLCLSCWLAAPALAQDPLELSVADATANEGDRADDGTVATMPFVVSRSATTTQVAFHYATSDGTAVEGEDYESASGTLTFASGMTQLTIEIPLVDDSLNELPETLELTLSKSNGEVIDHAVGTIEDDDPEPLFSISTTTIHPSEGLDSVVTVSLSDPSGRVVTVGYATRVGSTQPYAAPGRDYLRAEGTLTFAPGETSKSITIETLDDDYYEQTEWFVLAFFNPRGAKLSRHPSVTEQSILYCIEDDEPVPNVTIADAADVESAGELAFAVRLTGPIEDVVSMTYSTADGTAVAAEDYTAATGAALSFGSGVTRGTIRIAIIDDDMDEAASETFSVLLRQTYEPLADAVGRLGATGTIHDDDGAARLFANDATASEGDGELSFTVTLAGQSSASVTIDYETMAGSATVGEDYTETSGTLTFATGDTHRTITVPVLDDDTHELSETISLSLSNPGGAGLEDEQATGTILDDDKPPSMTIDGSEASETGYLDYVVSLGAPSGATVTVDYVTDEPLLAKLPAYRLAEAGSDFVHQRGSLTFAPGETHKRIQVEVLEDARDEPVEAVVITMLDPVNARFKVRNGSEMCPWRVCDIEACCDCGTIVDDDPPREPTTHRVLLFESAAHVHQQGFVRVINHSDEAGEVLVEAIDDAGMRLGPIPLAIGAGEARHFNSDDLEGGNAEKGLPDGVGPPGDGAWHLELSSLLDIEVLSYARTEDGFVTSLHDTAPAMGEVHRAVFLNPGGNVDQVSRLRLVNVGTEDARVTITGTDDAGEPSSEVVVAVPAGTAREWTAAELEAGTGTEGALGDGDGKWRLRLASDWPVLVLSLIESPTGHLTNLSTLPRTPGRTEDSHAVPLFPSASDEFDRQGFVRVVNHATTTARVRIEAFDHSDWDYETLELEVGHDEVGSFNSEDLELGNPDKGLTGSTGAGDGDWWLELTGDDIVVGAYVRTTDGFLTSMHDLVPEWEGGYRVVFFNPAENDDQVSVLWLVNPGEADADVTIRGVDDRGETPGTEIRLAVPAGSSRRLTSTQLESGAADALDSGALGDGFGKWRLRVVSSQPLMVMSLLENPTGHLTNLSTATDR